MELSCRLGITRCPADNNCSLSISQILNPLLTKLVRSRWLETASFFCVFIDLDSVSVHKRAKQRRWPISSHLERTLVFIFILSSLSHAVLVYVKMEAVAWINVTEIANVSVQKGTPEHFVKTFLQQIHHVRNTTKTNNLYLYFQCATKFAGNNYIY